MSRYVDDLRRVANLHYNDRITIAKDDVLALLDDYEALEARLAELEKDAARYRWLCDGHGYFLEEEMICGHESEKSLADAAIDKAMSREA